MFPEEHTNFDQQSAKSEQVPAMNEIPLFQASEFKYGYGFGASEPEGKKTSPLVWLYHMLRQEWKSVIIIIMAAMIQAAAVAYFILPYKFPDLGVSGIGVLMNYMFGISPSWIVLPANALMLLWGRKDLNGRFVFLTCCAIITFSIALPIFSGIQLPLPNDKFMGAVISGLLKGVAIGTMFNVGGSSGGIDIIAAVLRRRHGVEVGTVTSIINYCILGISISIVGLEAVVYGAMAVYVSSVTLDNVTKKFDRRKQVLIITNEPDKVGQFIMSTGRGVTLIDGKGLYSGQQRPILLAFLGTYQMVQVKHFLRDNDPTAFISICDVTEVVGRGFKSWKNM